MAHEFTKIGDCYVNLSHVDHVPTYQEVPAVRRDHWRDYAVNVAGRAVPRPDEAALGGEGVVRVHVRVRTANIAGDRSG